MMNKNVLEWLERHKDEPKIAYRDAQSGISFAEVCETAMRIGSALKAVQGAAPIAILSGRRCSTVCGYLGIVYSGHAYAPIDGSLPRARIEAILEQLQPAAVVADAEHLELASSLCGSALALEELAAAPVDQAFLQSVRDRMLMTDPLYVIFTSGSSGRPKGVVTSHQALMCYIESYTAVMEIESTEVLGNQSPLDYIAAIRDIYIPLLCGCSTLILPTELFMQPDRLFACMNRGGVTTLGWSVSALSVPVALGAFQNVGLSSVRKVCFSGSVMPPSVLRVWQTHLPRAKFVNQYGPTEATASCTYYELDHPVEPDEQLPIGKAYRHYRVFLLGEDLRPTPPGEVGEICVSGPILALGYYNDPERTAQAFVTNPNVPGYPERMYRTGDYGRLREDGLLEFHGRMDRQIKHMGHRVELDEIEYAANRVEGLDACAALYSQRTETIWLFYEGLADKRSLALALRESLPMFMLPRKILKLERLPRLANGKTDMNLLKERMEA